MSISQHRSMELYVAGSRRARRSVLRISHWDENDTIFDNRRRLRFQTNKAARQFAYNFGLTWKRLPTFGQLQQPTPFIRTKMRYFAAYTLAKKGFTLQQIGAAFGVTRERVNQIMRQYKGKV